MSAICSAPAAAKPCLGERNEDLHDEKESLHQHRSAPQSGRKCVPEKHEELLYPVLGENQDDSKNLHGQELECQRSATQSAASWGKP